MRWIIASLLALMISPPALAHHRHPLPKHHHHHKILDRLPATAGAFISCDLHGCTNQTVNRTETATARQETAIRIVHKPHHRRSLSESISSGLEWVNTAAGIQIQVAGDFAAKIEGFIADVVARGYHPHQIHCYASGGHVRGSLHYSGHACDFDQRGWGKTAAPMYHVADLCRKWGLRDGGEFRDWGHIDSGGHLSRAELHPPFYGATSDFKASL